MALKIEGVTHWSIPVDDLGTSEAFYGGLLGMEHVGRLGDSGMTCFSAGDNKILLCAQPKAGQGLPLVHHSFTVSPETLNEACKLFKEKKVDVVELVYRAQGYFTGRELYFHDPSGNRLELRDPTWQKGMPEPSYEELAAS